MTREGGEVDVEEEAVVVVAYPAGYEVYLASRTMESPDKGLQWRCSLHNHDIAVVDIGLLKRQIGGVNADMGTGKIVGDIWNIIE